MLIAENLKPLRVDLRSGEGYLASGLVRAFIAIDIPDGEVKEKILEFQRIISQAGADLKPVEPENIHITLRFLGDVRMAVIDNLKAELCGIRFSPFKITLKGVGVFPDIRRINVVWVGIDEGNIGLIDLYGKINRSLGRLGIPPDRRGLSPHLTVARVHSGRNRDIISKTVGGLVDAEFGSIEVNSFHLKQSTLTPRGPIYQSLCEVTASPP